MSTNTTDPRIAHYRISEDDYVEAFRIHNRMTPRRVLLIVVALLLELAAVIVSKDMRIPVVILLIGGTLTVLLVRLLVAPWLHRRNYRRYRLIQQPQTLELREEGLFFTRENGVALLAWGDILGWEQGERMLLVFIAPRLFNMIPRTIAAQGFPLQALEDELRLRVGPPRRMRAPRTPDANGSTPQ